MTGRNSFAAVLVGALLAAAPAALASDHNMRLNEISPSAGFVELLDVLPGGESLPRDYTVRSYDGAGNDFAAQDYPAPTPFAGSTVPFVLSLALPADSGQVCFEAARRPESTLPLDEYRLHCMGYGDVTNPVKPRMDISGPRPIAMPVAPTPGPGQTVQRQPCGTAALAAATRGAENAEVRAACAGRPVCDDPRRADNTKPHMTVKLPRAQDVDRPFRVKVTLDEPGEVELHGSFITARGRPLFVFGPLRREVRSNVTVRFRIPISRRATRKVKRDARRGKATRAVLATNGRDRACFRNVTHSDRVIAVVP